jgi:hypothetical protein
LVVLVAALSLAALPAAASSHAAAVTAALDVSSSVTVNATAGVGAIPSGAIGLNTAVYDQYMNDSTIPSLVKAAGIDAMRYPGGSYSDIYNWQTNVATGGYDAPNTDFDQFMATDQAAGASPIVTVNYGTGTPALAAAWVQDANVTHNYGVGYWEVGNEVYGNGFYGSQWETDSHSSKSPDTYAANFLQFRSAMKAVDANVKVCAVLTTPGFWPDGVVGSGDTLDWNHTVLAAIGSNLDCVIVHYYPGGSSTAGMLTDPTDISGIVHGEDHRHRDRLVYRHGHSARRAVRRGYVHDLAGERRGQRRLVGRAQRSRHGQHGERRDRLRRRRHLLERVERQRFDRARGRDPVRALLRHRDALEARLAGRRDGDVEFE